MGYSSIIEQVTILTAAFFKYQFQIQTLLETKKTIMKEKTSVSSKSPSA